MQAHEGLSPADFAKLFEPLSGFHHLLVAVSGGVDSTVLLHALCRWVQERSEDKVDAPKLSVACVDHGLRDGSAQEAQAVKRMAQALGCDCRILHWRGEKPVTGLQEKARDMRYSLLHGQARKIAAEAVVLAHHADDQAETLLMRMASGSGPEGLCGMRACSQRDGLMMIRPFLSVPKAALVATARAAHWHWHDDPSNQLVRFARVRLRHMQALREAAGLTSVRLGRLAARLTRQQEAIDWMVDQSWLNLAMHDQERLVLQADLWALPAEVGQRLLAKAVTVLNPQAALRLERLEVLGGALRTWADGQQSGRRTLGGCVFSLSAKGVLTVIREPVRGRGRGANG